MDPWFWDAGTLRQVQFMMAREAGHLHLFANSPMDFKWRIFCNWLTLIEITEQHEKSAAQRTALKVLPSACRG
jgi:hypothetical protein